MSALRPHHLLLLAPCLLGSCGESPPAPPNVILLSLDTLRADHLGCYGDERGLTPNLDRLAEESTLFVGSRSTAPWTVPSHASMFTGLYPFEHGAHTGPIQRGGENVSPLAPEHRTLAELLAEDGYATAGFVANAVYLAPRYGLAQGFDTWEVARDRADPLNERALAWVDALAEGAPGRPFFLFVNYLDTHRPYDVTAQAGEAEYDNADSPALVLDRLIQTVMVEGREAPELEALAREQYARSVRNLDLALGRLIEALRERGLLENSVLVVTSDHGEYLGEHGLVEHSKDVYEEGLRVPLIVRAPGQQAGKKVDTPASSVDVPGLIAASLPAESALSASEPRRVGEHLVLAQNHFSRPRDVLQPAYGRRFQRIRSAVYSGPWKFIHSSDGAHELYRIAEGEAVDRAAEEGELVADFAEKLEQLIERGRWRGPTVELGEMSAELEEQMRALGYVGEEGG